MSPGLSISFILNQSPFHVSQAFRFHFVRDAPACSRPESVLVHRFRRLSFRLFFHGPLSQHPAHELEFL